MTKQTPCITCGRPVENDGLNGLCASCILMLVVEDSGSAVPLSSPGETAWRLGIPGYEVRQEISRGGMGIVYRAVQLEPRREVALKMLLPHQATSPGMLERFRLEARAIAALEHPAILPVHHVGEHHGLPFFTMKLAAGGTLAHRKDQFAGAWREIAELMATLADAVQFAHERGVLHRDLKPGNVLFDEAGRPYVSDFGLAKLVGIESGLTRSMEMLGTPHYVAPEVAARSAKEATTASDIYSLGAIFYELLAGRPPFEADGMPALLRKIAEEEPPRPSGHRANRTARAPIAKSETRNRVLAATNIPRDMEVICLKCLAKEPPRRYATARELADDLRRWLEGRTILARPATRFERVGSWVRRNPALAAVSTVLALVLVAAIVVEARSNRRLQQALAESLLRQAQLERSSGRAGQRFEALALIAGAAKRAQSSGIEMSLSNLVSMRSEIAAALALPDVRPRARWPVPVSHLDSEIDFTPNLDSYVTPTADGGFTVVSAVQRSPLHHFVGSSNNPVIKLRAHPGGQWVAARFRDGHAELHPLTLTNEPIRRWPGMPNTGASFCFDPAGRFLAVITHPSTGPRFAEIFDLNSGATRARVPAVGATAVAFDPTGVRLALGGVELVVWRVPDTEKLWSAPLTHAIDTLAWSPDGNRIAVALDRRRPLGEQEPLQASPVLIFDGVNGGQESLFGEFGSPVGRIAFHPDGQRLAVATWESGLILGGLEPPGERLLFEGAHRALTFSSGGDQLGYSPTREELGLLEVAVPSTFRRWQSRGPSVEESFTMDGSKDGRWIATASSTRVRLWDAVSRREIDSRPLPAKGRWVEVLFGSANECVYASAAIFGVRRFGLTKATDGRLCFSDERTVGESNSFLTVGFAHDGRSLLVTENRGRMLAGQMGPLVWLWPDADPGRARKLADNYPLLGYRVVPGSRWGITTALVAPDVSIWNFETGERVRNLGLPGRASSAPVANGRWVVAKTAEEFGVWEVNSWKRLARWPARSDETPMNIFTSPDSRLLATHNPSGRFVLRALPNGKELILLTPPQAIPVQYHQFSPDSNRLRFMGNNGEIFEWDLIAIRQELARLGLDWPE